MFHVAGLPVVPSYGWRNAMLSLSVEWCVVVDISSQEFYHICLFCQPRPDTLLDSCFSCIWLILLLASLDEDANKHHEKYVLADRTGYSVRVHIGEW
jgi:hypothetical protein